MRTFSRYFGITLLVAALARMAFVADGYMVRSFILPDWLFALIGIAAIIAPTVIRLVQYIRLYLRIRKNARELESAIQ